MLSVAAVIGRELRLDVLRRVADLGEDELYAPLEEAQGSGGSSPEAATDESFTRNHGTAVTLGRR